MVDGDMKAWEVVAEMMAEHIYDDVMLARSFALRLRKGLFKGEDNLVYFITREDHAGAIKIGWSGDLKKRLQDLQAGRARAAALMATARGGLFLEQMLHTVFARDALRGEWFRRSRTLEMFVESLGAPPKRRPR